MALRTVKGLLLSGCLTPLASRWFFPMAESGIDSISSLDPVGGMSAKMHDCNDEDLLRAVFV